MEILIKICILSLKTHFSDILYLSREESLIAAVLLLHFKLRWYNVLKRPQKTVGDIRRTIIMCGKNSWCQNKQGNKFEDYLDFEAHVNNNSTVTIIPTSKIEPELLRYFEGTSDQT